MTVKWSKLDKQQPDLGFESKIKVEGLTKGSGQTQVHKIKVHSSCREDLNYHVRRRLRFLTYKEIKIKLPSRPSWAWSFPEYQQTAEINLDVSVTKQPFITRIWIDIPNEKVSLDRAQLIEVTDALVGPVCVLLNPDRYQGNWWETSVSESEQFKRKYRHARFSWYGTDNFFLHHPALLSIVFGLFRQSVRLVRAKQVDGLFALAPRNEVKKVLTDADPEKSLKLIRKLSPYITARHSSDHYPIRKPNFNFLLKLHTAIYKHGLTTVFGGEVSQTWECKQQPHFDDIQGSQVYFGFRSNSAAAKRIKKLAHK